MLRYRVLCPENALARECFLRFPEISAPALDRVSAIQPGIAHLQVDDAFQFPPVRLSLAGALPDRGRAQEMSAVIIVQSDRS